MRKQIKFDVLTSVLTIFEPLCPFISYWRGRVVISRFESAVGSGEPHLLVTVLSQPFYFHVQQLLLHNFCSNFCYRHFMHVLFTLLDIKMDLASVLIGLTICAVTAVVLYFISVKSFQVYLFYNLDIFMMC